VANGTPLAISGPRILITTTQGRSSILARAAPDRAAARRWSAPAPTRTSPASAGDDSQYNSDTAFEPRKITEHRADEGAKRLVGVGSQCGWALTGELAMSRNFEFEPPLVLVPNVRVHDLNEGITCDTLRVLAAPCHGGELLPSVCDAA
jgi:hypothetical protein